MENSNKKQISSLLKKHGYQVIVSVDDGRPATVSVIFPERKQKPFFTAFSVKYRHKSSGVSKGIFRKIDDYEEIFLECSTYAISEVILASISQMCKIIRYNDEFIHFDVNGNESTKEQFELEAFQFRLNKQQKEKKSELSGLLKAAAIGNFGKEFEKMAEEKGLLKEYDIIKNIHTKEVGI